MAKRMVKCYYCGKKFDANAEESDHIPNAARRYAHKACGDANNWLTKEVIKKQEMEQAKAENKPYPREIYKCFYCGQLVQGIDAVRVGVGKYCAHKECYEKYHTKDDDYTEQIYDLLNRVGIQYNYQKVEKQRSKFLDSNISDEDIYKTLHYWYEIKHNSIAKANGGIGIVPYVIDVAEAYYREVEEIKRRNEINRKETDYNKVAAAVSQLYDTSPKVSRKPVRPSLIDMNSLKDMD